MKQLQAKLKKCGCDTQGRKTQLCDRLLQHHLEHLDIYLRDRRKSIKKSTQKSNSKATSSSTCSHQPLIDVSLFLSLSDSVDSSELSEQESDTESECEGSENEPEIEGMRARQEQVERWFDKLDKEIPWVDRSSFVTDHLSPRRLSLHLNVSEPKNPNHNPNHNPNNPLVHMNRDIPSLSQVSSLNIQHHLSVALSLLPDHLSSSAPSPSPSPSLSDEDMEMIDFTHSQQTEKTEHGTQLTPDTSPTPSDNHAYSQRRVSRTDEQEQQAQEVLNRMRLAELQRDQRQLTRKQTKDPLSITGQSSAVLLDVQLTDRSRGRRPHRAANRVVKRAPGSRGLLLVATSTAGSGLLSHNRSTHNHHSHAQTPHSGVTSLSSGHTNSTSRNRKRLGSDPVKGGNGGNRSFQNFQNGRDRGSVSTSSSVSRSLTSSPIPHPSVLYGHACGDCLLEACGGCGSGREESRLIGDPLGCSGDSMDSRVGNTLDGSDDAFGDQVTFEPHERFGREEYDCRSVKFSLSLSLSLSLFLFLSLSFCLYTYTHIYMCLI